MEQNHLISDLEEELKHIDVDSIKLDAIIQLKTWQKKMYSLVDKTYKNRMHEIDSITSNITNEIKEKQNEIETNDQHTFDQLKQDIESLKSNICIEESIPENFDQRIERTIRVSRDMESEDEVFLDDDDDEPVIVDFDRHEGRTGEQVIVVVAAATQQSSVANEEGRISRVFKSEPIQHALAVSLAKTLANIGVVAATSTTTIAATTMAKTAIIATACGVGTVAYGVGRLAIGTTRKVWSLIVSSDD